MHPPRRSALRAALRSLACGALAAAALTGCGGGDDEDPLAPYRTQTVNWAACEPTILGADTDKLRDAWKRLGDRLQCAYLRAPMDWNAPDKGDVAVSLMRVASAQPQLRQGSLLTNPGGPGGDGLGSALSLYFAYAGSNPDTALGKLQLQLLDTYDFIGFSPRGMGDSTSVVCTGNAFMRPTGHTQDPLDPVNLDNALYNGKYVAAACARNPITPHIHTEATARDMDLIRTVLGDERLNYIGYSYGTWLGAWYAGLYPERVGRMVLDSVWPLSDAMETRLFDLPRARQAAHTDILLPYAARHDGYFGLGTSAAGVQARIAQLDWRIRNALGLLGGAIYDRSDSDKYVASIKAGTWLDAAFRAAQTAQAGVPPAQRNEAIAQAVEQAIEQAAENQDFVPGPGTSNALVQEQVAALWQGSGRLGLSPAQPASYRGQEGFWTVSCNDDASDTDLSAWRQRFAQATLDAPLFAGVLLDDVCLFWSRPGVQKPAIERLKDLPILLIQDEYDSATPAPGAMRMFALLPKAQLIYVPGEYHHGLFPYMDDCVDLAATRYLLGASLAQRQTDCPALPLKQDAQALQKAGQIGTASAYLDPQEAERLIRHYKRFIRP